MAAGTEGGGREKGRRRGRERDRRRDRESERGRRKAERRAGEERQGAGGRRQRAVSYTHLTLPTNREV
eukprot:10612593-Heterocapsa_arctica.AAC.1